MMAVVWFQIETYLIAALYMIDDISLAELGNKGSRSIITFIAVYKINDTGILQLLLLSCGVECASEGLQSSLLLSDGDLVEIDIKKLSEFPESF